MYKIYHNPRCTKSRQTLKLLEENEVKPEVILYLGNPPTERELEKIIKLLNIKPIELVRTKEAVWKELGLKKDTADKHIIKAMADNPTLIERPIVIKDNKKAALGRPPENVLELF